MGCNFILRCKMVMYNDDLRSFNHNLGHDLITTVVTLHDVILLLERFRFDFYHWRTETIPSRGFHYSLFALPTNSILQINLLTISNQFINKSRFSPR